MTARRESVSASEDLDVVLFPSTQSSELIWIY